MTARNAFGKLCRKGSAMSVVCRLTISRLVISHRLQRKEVSDVAALAVGGKVGEDGSHCG